MISLQAAPGAQSGWSSILMIVALIAIFYFMMIRPQQKQQKKLREFREGLKKGDRVLTSGGLFGKIEDVKEQYFLVNVGDGIKVRVAKGCVFDSEVSIQENAQADSAKK